MTVDYSMRKSNNRIDSTNPLSHQIVDADCTHETGKLMMKGLPSNLPSLFTIRFTAPVDYTQGEVIVVGDKEMPVRTPCMTSATSSIFRIGAVVHADIDLERGIAFCWQGASGGSDRGGDYSFDEQATGCRWVDGRMIYRKTVKFPSLLANKELLVAHNIVDYDHIVDGYGVAYNPLTSALRPIPYRDGLYWFISNKTHWGVGVLGDGYGSYAQFTEVYMTFEYVCAGR